VRGRGIRFDVLTGSAAATGLDGEIDRVSALRERPIVD
jgi:hypothetical protein